MGCNNVLSFQEVEPASFQGRRVPRKSRAEEKGEQPVPPGPPLVPLMPLSTQELLLQSFAISCGTGMIWGAFPPASVCMCVCDCLKEVLQEKEVTQLSDS